MSLTATKLFAFLGDELSDHEPCADCVRCATCRREWCPTVSEKCPGEKAWRRHPTGSRPGGVKDDQEYCYKCKDCPGGYHQFYDPAHPGCQVIEPEPHMVATGKGDQ